jgi:hypothetical protein
MIEMRTKLILKNGYKFQGAILEETLSDLIIDEIKLGHTKIAKSSIAVRSDSDF